MSDSPNDSLNESLNESLGDPMKDPRDHLVSPARAGDASARSGLFDAVLPRIQQFLIPKMGSKLQRHTDLDDVCQEIFIRGIKAIHALEPNSGYRDFEALMLQHARWQVVDSARAEGRFEGESNVPGGLMTIPIDADVDQGEGLLIEREDVEWLHSLISRLPDDHANIVWLRLDGFKSDEIAQMLSISPELVRKRHQRAVETLRKLTA